VKLISGTILILVVCYSAPAEEIELIYDDNSPSSCFTLGCVAVRFTAPEGVWRVKTFRYLSCFETGKDVRVRILEDSSGFPGEDIFSGALVSSSIAGWNDVDLSPEGIQVKGDFYAGLECVDTTSFFDIAASSPGNTRGWEYLRSHQDWEPRDAYTFYLRVVITEKAGVEEEIKPMVFDSGQVIISKAAKIGYTLSEPTNVKIDAWEACGERIKTLKDGFEPPGNYSVDLVGTDNRGERLPRGVYFISIECDRARATQKIVIVR